MLKISVLAFAVVVAFSCILLASAEPSWTSLRATWGINIFSSRVFAKLPRRESKARRDGWTKLAGECSGGKFLGHRYMKGLDTAAVLIYDVNGYIAGVQNGVPKSDTEKVNGSYDYSRPKAYQLDTVYGEEEVYFLTTYFVDPLIICNDGRSDADYEAQGTGTELYFQNGSDPIHNSVKVPLYENTTTWVRGGCFPSMGVHYWYDMSEHMSCNYLFPFTAIYNRGKLTSFAFIWFGNFEFSTRFEHPPKSSFSRFLPEPVPTCIDNEYDASGGISSMHVYFTVRPWNFLC